MISTMLRPSDIRTDLEWVLSALRARALPGFSRRAAGRDTIKDRGKPLTCFNQPVVSKLPGAPLKKISQLREPELTIPAANCRSADQE